MAIYSTRPMFIWTTTQFTTFLFISIQFKSIFIFWLKTSECVLFLHRINLIELLDWNWKNIIVDFIFVSWIKHCFIALVNSKQMNRHGLLVHFISCTNFCFFRIFCHIWITYTSNTASTQRVIQKFMWIEIDVFLCITSHTHTRQTHCCFYRSPVINTSDQRLLNSFYLFDITRQTLCFILIAGLWNAKLSTQINDCLNQSTQNCIVHCEFILINIIFCITKCCRKAIF